MNNPFRPTHVITFVGRQFSPNAAQLVRAVSLADGRRVTAETPRNCALFFSHEWHGKDDADYVTNDEGVVIHRGQRRDHYLGPWRNVKADVWYGQPGDDARAYGARKVARTDDGKDWEVIVRSSDGFVLDESYARRQTFRRKRDALIYLNESGYTEALS